MLNRKSGDFHYKNNTPSQSRLAWVYYLTQPNRFHLRHEAVAIGFHERRDHFEHGITEAADVQDVASLWCLRGGAGLNVDADQLGASDVATLECHLVLHELLPLRHHAGVLACTIDASPALVDPALVIAHQHHASKLALAVSLQCLADGQRAVGSTTTILGQPFGQAEDGVV
jgi:hypothetical protein